MAGVIHQLSDSGELVELFKSQGLYLKPVARLHISIQLPQLKDPSQSISNWDLMERLKKMVRPHEFASLKVQKSTIEFVRFEAECDNRTILTLIIEKLEGSTIKIIGFFDALKVRCGEAKQNFPTQHEWDAFFREAKHMNELKPGERPDTIYLANIPCKWFLDLKNKASREANERGEPSEFVLRRVFEQFGEVRCVDIPVCDPYRQQMSKSAVQTFTHGTEATFDAYVQYVEYIGFKKAMNALKGMKLVHIDDEARVWAANIRVSDKFINKIFNRNPRFLPTLCCKYILFHFSVEIIESVKHLK